MLKAILLMTTLVFLIPLFINPQTINSQLRDGFQIYENPNLGIRFQYPTSWGEPLDIGKQCFKYNCQVVFMVASPPTVDVFGITVEVTELHKPITRGNACNCTNLKEYATWDYNNNRLKEETFMNDNQTTLRNNITAWQMESKSIDSKLKSLIIWTVNGNLGYRFGYTGPIDAPFDKYLGQFKNMLNSVIFEPVQPEKRPSFLNSTNIANTSTTGNSIPFLNKSSITILSHNSYIDSIGYFHVVGEVKNNTPRTAEFVQITGTFYDINNAVVGTHFTYTNPSDISSGATVPFDLILMSASIPTSLIDHYKLVASYE